MPNETLKKLKNFLDGLAAEKKKIQEEDKEDKDTVNLALLLSGLSIISEKDE